jgi:hypothetical protein
MRLRLAACLLQLVVAAVIHLDWHIARPTHHRLSLGWEHHWIFSALVFGAIGWLIARWWPERAMRAGATVFGVGIVLAQVVEPVLEVAFYENRFGYPQEPGRWGVFAVCLASGLPAAAFTLWLCRPVRTTANA